MSISCLYFMSIPDLGPLVHVQNGFVSALVLCRLSAYVPGSAAPGKRYAPVD